MMKSRTFILLILTLLMTACADRDKHGSLSLFVSHEVDAQTLVTDTLCYKNEAGNPYLVNEVQWFMSNLEIEDLQGRWIPLADVWYIDTNIPERTTLHIPDLPASTYRTLRFTFGLNDADNQSGRFNNPPESNMFWPDELGGGYHYMKLNGKYQTTDGLLAPLAIHLGRGQNADLTAFYDNSFVVELPIELDLQEGSTLTLAFNLNNWFRNPHVYDFNTYGSAIMQNQEAQSILKANGNDVFKAISNLKMESPLKTGTELLQKAAPQPHFMTWENIKKRMESIKERL